MIIYGLNFLFNFLGGYFVNSFVIMMDVVYLLLDFVGFMILLLVLWVVIKFVIMILFFGWYCVGKIFKYVFVKVWEKFCMGM